MCCGQQRAAEGYGAGDRLPPRLLAGGLPVEKGDLKEQGQGPNQTRKAYSRKRRAVNTTVKGSEEINPAKWDEVPLPPSPENRDTEGTVCRRNQVANTRPCPSIPG